MSSSLSGKLIHTQPPSHSNSMKPEQKDPQQKQPEKLLKSFEKFSVSNTEYYVGIIRRSRSPSFRLSMTSTEDSWFTNELQYDDVRNQALGANMDIKSHLITALSTPNHEEYEIQGTIINKKKGGYLEIKILRKSDDLSILMATINLYRHKRRGTNLFYLFDKVQKTLWEIKKENNCYRSDNINFQKKYQKSLELVNEATKVKNAQERELLSKFVMVLNEKKKKIRQLQAEIMRLKGGNHSNTHSVSNDESLRIDEEIKDLGVNVKDNDKEMDIDFDGNNDNKRKDDDLLMGVSDKDDVDFGLSMAMVEQRSMSFATNKREGKKRNKGLEFEDGNRNRKRKYKAKSSVIDDETLDVGDMEGDWNKDRNVNHRKRKRHDVDEEMLELVKEPENKKRKLSEKDVENDDSDSSYDFNPDSLI